MIDHVTIRVAGLDPAHDLYEPALRLLGRAMTAEDEWEDFSIAAGPPSDPRASRLHVGFGAKAVREQLIRGTRWRRRPVMG